MHEHTSGLHEVRAPWTLFTDPEKSGTKIGPRRSRVEKVDQTRAIRAALAGQSVVYAVRFPDGIIKIGCSSNFAQRLRHFRGKDGVPVGFMLGDLDDEAAIHASLKPHRAHGFEWYNPTPEVLAVVNGMRDAFNLPHIAA